MGSEHERPKGGDGGTTRAYTDYGTADDVNHGKGSPTRGEGAA